MEIFVSIIGLTIIIAVVFLLIAIIPVLFGKLFFRWSKRRALYVLSESFSTIIATAIVSLVITGLVLLIGILFKQEWAFSGGLLILYVFWTAIKAVRENIRNSKWM
jgi:hypothetical protein